MLSRVPREGNYVSKILLFHPQMYPAEWQRALAGTFSTRWLGQGPRVDEFEEEFGRRFDYEHCLAVNSGSAALELAYHLLDLGGPSEEVITPVLTCTATNLPLLRRGVKLVFADVNGSLTIDVEDVARKITSRTEAIVAVTLGGLPIDPALFDLAAEKRIPVVVDAAQSLGVREKQGDYICYSFQAIKHFTTGDGGMLVCKWDRDHERAKRLRWFGIDREAKRRVDFNCMVDRQITQEIWEPGYKFHMNDIAATMGLVGLKHSNEILDYRRRLCEHYVAGLPDFITPVWGGACWLFGIFAPDRDELIEHLRSNGVECDLVQLRNDIFQVFEGRRRDLPKMNELESRYLYLPLNSRVTEDDVNYICTLVREFYE